MERLSQLREHFKKIALELNVVAFLIIIFSGFWQKYLITYFVFGVLGALCERYATRIGLWRYFNKEKPPFLVFFDWASAGVIFSFISNVLYSLLLSV